MNFEELENRVLENRKCINCKHWQPYECYNEKSEKYLKKYKGKVLATDCCKCFRTEISQFK